MRHRWYVMALLVPLAACSAERVDLAPAPGLVVPVEVTTTTTATAPVATTTVPVTTVTSVPAVNPLEAGTTTASWYGGESGSHTANGDRYNPSGLTFAHRSLKFGTAVRFCGPLGCVVATCVDRGPASWTGRDFDLSEGSFAKVAPLSKGVARLTWEVVQ